MDKRSLKISYYNGVCGIPHYTCANSGYHRGMQPADATATGRPTPPQPPQLQQQQQQHGTRGESNDACHQNAGRTCTHVGQLKGRARCKQRFACSQSPQEAMSVWNKLLRKEIRIASFGWLNVEYLHDIKHGALHVSNGRINSRLVSQGLSALEAAWGGGENVIWLDVRDLHDPGQTGSRSDFITNHLGTHIKNARGIMKSPALNGILCQLAEDLAGVATTPHADIWIAIMCRSGRHRSVFLSEALAAILRKLGP
eukprot:5373860-Amphidinium_carterae.3